MVATVAMVVPVEAPIDVRVADQAHPKMLAHRATETVRVDLPVRLLALPQCRPKQRPHHRPRRFLLLLQP